MNIIRLLKTARIKPVIRVCHAEYSTQHPLRFTEVQDKWREKDGVSKNWQLIYKAPMDRVINLLSSFMTLSSSTIAVSTIYYATCMFDINTINDPMIVGENVVIANNATEVMVYLTSFFVFNIAVKILINKYVLRLYKNGDEYVAVFRGHWYNSIFKHKFHLTDFKKLSPTLVVSWGDARYDLGNKHGILMDHYFKAPEYLNYLLYKKKNKLNSDS